MPILPFPFNAERYQPLQPEDSDREFELRSDPRYASMYANNAELEYQAQAESVAPNEYLIWRHTCAQMESETNAARLVWREALTRRDNEVARLNAELEETRRVFRKLDARPKPMQPRTTRKGT